MRFEGLLKTWNDERGFGFIQTAIAGQEVFVHIKSFPAGFGRPAPGLKITYEVEQGTDGKKRAKSVQMVRTMRAKTQSGIRRPAQWAKSSICALAAFALLYLLVTIVWGTPTLLVFWYVLIGLACGGLYAQDKASAEEGTWRTPEITLLMFGLIGGWPGAMVAQQMLRHKTSKIPYQIAFWTTIVVNVFAFLVYTTPIQRALKG